MIKKLAIPLSLAAAALLAGCAHERVVTAQPVAVAPSGTVAYIYPSGYVAPNGPFYPYVYSSYVLRPGFGRVDSVTPVYYVGGAATGTTRLRLIMQDGSVQIIDTNGPSVAIGAWVEVTPQLAVTYPVAAR